LRVDSFRRLVTAALLAGTLAGGLLAMLQLAAVGPLIALAETYERQAPTPSEDQPGAHAHAAADEWEPSAGVERTGYTVLGTVLMGIAYAALLLGAAALLGVELDVRTGVWLGLAGCACFAVAPSLGLPPKPPGVPGADVHAAQVWWAGTAVATAIGLTLIAAARGRWGLRVIGLLCLAAPHVIGAPQPLSAPEVPEALIRRFAVTSVATQAAFWLLLGAIAGYVSGTKATKIDTETTKRDELSVVP
jgi:cobalt transporter subunit CbtA